MFFQFVLSEMFDIRPLKNGGILDFEKIKKIKKILNLRNSSKNTYTSKKAQTFANDSELNQDIILAELNEIELREGILKMELMNFGRGRKITVKGEDGSEVKKITIVKSLFSHCEESRSTAERRSNLETTSRDCFASLAMAKDGEQKVAAFFKEKPLEDQLREKINLPLIFFIVFLLVLNVLLVKDFIRDGFFKIVQNKKINFYGNILESGKEFLTFENFSLIKDFVKDYDVALKFLGFQRPQKYLLIFQNNSEMRATGGFIGSYAILDLDQGKIKNFFSDDVYNIDGQLQEKIEPPKPLLKVADFWSMHDANWFADFPTSAKKIAWFYEKAGGPTVDGVISLTPAVVEGLLKIIGPIDLLVSPSGGTEYNLVISSDNFIEEMQNQTEDDSARNSGQPKKILIAFVSKFFQKMQTAPKSDWPRILEIFSQLLKEKHILFYFRDSALENFVLKQKWGGQVLETGKDYLSVVNSNLGGAKTDLFIEERIEHQAEISDSGSVIDTIKIFRYHRGGKTKYDWWNKPNIDYLRVYVPLGAELINPDHGTEIFEESNKTVFARWVTTDPGQTTIIEYKYLLPFKIFNQYSLLIQKQSGSPGSQLFSRVRALQKEWENSDVLKEDKFYEISL